MKRWGILLAVLLLAAWKIFPSRDVGDLQPIEVLYVYPRAGLICIDSDTGDQGVGRTAGEAFRDLRQRASGEVFLDTADYLLLSPGMESELDDLWRELRPGCRVCWAIGMPDLEQVGAFLAAHEPETTLLLLRSGAETLPILRTTEGGMRLAKP